MKHFSTPVNDKYNLRVATSVDQTCDYFLPQAGVVDGEFLDFIWEKKGKIKARIAFSISNNEARSFPKVPFGGIWCDEKLGSSALDNFIEAIIKELKIREIKFISIIQPPKPYVSPSDLINYLLFKKGFKQEEVIHYQFFVGKKKIKNFIEKDPNDSNLKKHTTGISIAHHSISSFGFLKEMRQWNEKRGYKVSMDENRLIQQVSVFPERYFLISLKKENEIIGYALAVKLTSNSIYYAMSATNPELNMSNGGELIVGELFKLATKLKVDFIDLGSSDLEPGANHSLMFFKSKFSNESSNKIVWTKEL